MFNDANRGALHRHSNLVMSFEKKRNLLVPGAVQPVSREGRARRWYLTATDIESRKQEEERIRQENVRLEERTRIAQELHEHPTANFPERLSAPRCGSPSRTQRFTGQEPVGADP